jgi:hypothetical protein
MVDVVACPGGALCDPIWDAAIIGGTVWLWILIFILVVVIATIGIWIYRNLKMADVKEFVDAVRLGLQQAIECNANRSLYIRALEYNNHVLSFRDLSNVSRWVVKSVMSAGHLGGVSAYMIGDDFDQTKDPPVEMAVCKISEDWNRDFESGAFKDMPGPIEAIVDYASFTRLSISGILEAYSPEGVMIDVYAPYDPLMIHKYTPRNQGAGMTGAKILDEAKILKVSQPEEKGLMRYAPMAAASTLVLIGAILTFVMVTK